MPLNVTELGICIPRIAEILKEMLTQCYLYVDSLPIPGAQSSMRHSKSMPEGHPMGIMGPPAQPRRLNNKWPSVYTDSGISLLSTDTLTKSSNVDMQSASTSSSRPLSRTMHADMTLANTATLLQESSRTEDSRRFVQTSSARVQRIFTKLPSSSFL